MYIFSGVSESEWEIYILCVPLLWELAKVSICVILHSLMPTGFFTKSTYTPNLKFNGVTEMLSLPLFK